MGWFRTVSVRRAFFMQAEIRVSLALFPSSCGIFFALVVGAQRCSASLWAAPVPEGPRHAGWEAQTTRAHRWCRKAMLNASRRHRQRHDSRCYLSKLRSGRVTPSPPETSWASRQSTPGKGDWNGCSSLLRPRKGARSGSGRQVGDQHSNAGC